MKNGFIRLIAMTIAFVMVMVLAGCDQEKQPDADIKYTICVANNAGTALEKCKVDVFADDSMSTVVYTGITNKGGEVSFTAPASENYVATISRQPTGYGVAQSYAVAGEKTTIVLTPGVMTDADMNSVRYSLGDAVMDFSVTTPDGSELVLSRLLQEKKAVVLNFWFLNCNPCKMEFPFIQESYEQLSNDIAVLALNPYDGTDAEVAKFQSDNGYTFTMAKCDERWHDMMKIQSYPTTVIVDRYGNICLIHNGMIKSTQEFVDMVNYFISDEYEQQFFKSAGQIPAVNN